MRHIDGIYNVLLFILDHFSMFLGSAFIYFIMFRSVCLR